MVVDPHQEMLPPNEGEADADAGGQPEQQPGNDLDIIDIIDLGNLGDDEAAARNRGV